MHRFVKILTPVLFSLKYLKKTKNILMKMHSVTNLIFLLCDDSGKKKVRWMNPMASSYGKPIPERTFLRVCFEKKYGLLNVFFLFIAEFSTTQLL